MSLAVVVLAGGVSRRFGAADKLAAPEAGQPLLRHVLRLARAVPARCRIVVLRRGARPPAGLGGFTVVRVEGRAIGESLRRAARAARRAGACRLLVLLGDMPALVPADLRPFRQAPHRPQAAVPAPLSRTGPAALSRTGPAALPRTGPGAQAQMGLAAQAQMGPAALSRTRMAATGARGMPPGPPVLIPARLIGRLLAPSRMAGAGAGAGPLLRRQPDLLRRPLPPAHLRDVDRPGDLRPAPVAPALHGTADAQP